MHLVSVVGFGESEIVLLKEVGTLNHKFLLLLLLLLVLFLNN